MFKSARSRHFLNAGVLSSAPPCRYKVIAGEMTEQRKPLNRAPEMAQPLPRLEGFGIACAGFCFAETIDERNFWNRGWPGAGSAWSPPEIMTWISSTLTSWGVN